MLIREAEIQVVHQVVSYGHRQGEVGSSELQFVTIN